MKTRKSIAIVQILGLAILRELFLLCYLYLNKGCDIGFWRLVSGGIEVEKSKYILCVVIYIFPDILLCHYVCNRYITQLKQNYIYIFTRERNMKKWLKKFIIISFFDIVLYEIISTGMFFFTGNRMHEKLVTQVYEFVTIIILHIIKLAFIIIFCDIFLIKFNEMVSIYSNLLIQALPVFLTGILYDMNGSWEMAVKYIPVNWCNYNYILKAEINPVVIICLLCILIEFMYLYLKKVFKDYEAI